MNTLDYSEGALTKEIERIVAFIRSESMPDRKLLLGLSGGLDSDVTARLCERAVGPERMKCFTVLQDQFDPRHLENARILACDLGIDLVEIPLQQVPKELITILADADPAVGFLPEGLLDVARSKCAIRTFIFSAYSERGYLVVGPSNRTEVELGYFLPFGDGLSHISPIIHLYKTQVRQLAGVLGTRSAVINQQPSAGFWLGDEDLEGIAYWLYNEGPIQVDLDLTAEEEEVVRQIHQALTFRKLDCALQAIAATLPTGEIASKCGLSNDIVTRLQALVTKSRLFKTRRLVARLEPKAAKEG